MYKIELKKIIAYQKSKIRVMIFADCLTHTKTLMSDMNALDVFTH